MADYRPAVLDLFESVGAADFGAESVGFVHGGVYQRPGLSLAQRQLVTIAALRALGYADAQLRFHVGAAANVGCEQEQIDRVLAAEEGDLDGETPASPGKPSRRSCMSPCTRAFPPPSTH